MIDCIGTVLRLQVYYYLIMVEVGGWGWWMKEGGSMNDGVVCQAFIP